MVAGAREFFRAIVARLSLFYQEGLLCDGTYRSELRCGKRHSKKMGVALKKRVQVDEVGASVGGDTTRIFAFRLAQDEPTFVFLSDFTPLFRDASAA